MDLCFDIEQLKTAIDKSLSESIENLTSIIDALEEQRAVIRVNELFGNLLTIEKDLKLPSLTKASEMMGVSEGDVRKFLTSKGLLSLGSDFIGWEAVSALADNYVVRMHRYFDNFISNMKILDEGFADFITFTEHYSRKGYVTFSWCDIDTARLRRDFIIELTRGTELECIYYVKTKSSLKNNCNAIRRIVRSYLYHVKLRTKSLVQNGMDDETIYSMIANHFHIFSSESDDISGTVSCSGNYEFKIPHTAIMSPLAV